jgi:parvulin-like peptidyl-prolyl isomerase
MAIAPETHSSDTSVLFPTSELILALQRENEQLREALQTRVTIEQAKGAVSARFGISPDEAFDLVRWLARSQRRRLREFAAEVVANRGELDAAEIRSRLADDGVRAVTESRLRLAEETR